MKNFILIPLMLILFSACNVGEDMDKTIYFVRHAEKDTTTDKDPSLTVDGVMRSVDLASWFKNIEVDTVFSSDYQRTIETAQPLIKAKRLELGKYDPKDFEGFAKILTEIEADTIVVIGHTDNILKQIEALEADRPQEEIKESEYNKIFELKLNSKEVVVHQYGKE